MLALINQIPVTHKIMFTHVMFKYLLIISRPMDSVLLQQLYRGEFIRDSEIQLFITSGIFTGTCYE